MDDRSPPTIDDLRAAHDRIRPHAHRTPVLRSRSLDRMAGATLFFKCENLQRVGAFKFRGATNAVLSMSDEQAARGVATHSSGNHAQAVALAARIRGVDAHIVMPKNAPAVKRAAVEGYGARVIDCEPTLESRETTLAEVVSETGAQAIHPYDDARVIAGQGTAAIELLEEVPDLTTVCAPIGGGGLISGTAIAVAAIAPNTRVVAAEPEAADDAARSFRLGRRVPSEDPVTICDGLRTSVGVLNFEVVRAHVADVVTVSEAEILSAMRHVWERMKIIIEPSAAVPVAAALDGRLGGGRIGIILSGGNLELGPLFDSLAAPKR